VTLPFRLCDFSILKSKIKKLEIELFLFDKRNDKRKLPVIEKNDFD
jgi:hypothetical protein